jgi:hypothetical protein
MIRGDGKRLPAGRMLLHLTLPPEGYSAVALALNVIARDSTSALCRGFDWCPRRRHGLGDKARLGERNVFIRTLPVKRIATAFQPEGDSSVRPRIHRCVDHTLGIL